MTKPRLSREAWIDAGLDALCDHGFAALKAEPLARRLNTTKGSFYWHFKDVPDFHTALLDQWQKNALPDTEDTAAVVALRTLAMRLAEPGNAEPAIRAWAKGNTQAARRLDYVDSERLTHFRRLLGEIGVANPEMARILYGAALGMQEMQDNVSAGPEAMGTLVDLILALR